MDSVRALENVFTARRLVTAGLVVAGMMTVDPVLSKVEDLVSFGHAKAMRDSPIYRAAVSAGVVIAADYVSEKLV